jgi:DNA repair exonuclease SbcCD ATPase subunit
VSSVEELSRSVVAARRRVDQRVGELRSLVSQVKDMQAEHDAAKASVETLDKVCGVLNTIGEERQGAAQQKIEALVTRGLQTIFSEELSFHVVPSTRGKVANVDFIVRSTLADGRVIDTPVMEARGGGLAATVGFLLRIVVILLSPSDVSRVLFLDETFAHVSAEYEPRLAEFLRELVDKTDIQVVLVTHSSAYSDVADSVYRFSAVDGETRVTKE